MVQRALTGLVAMIWLSCCALGDTEPPPAFKRIAEERARWRNGTVRWHKIHNSTPGRVLYYETRFVSDSVWETFFGDEEGFIGEPVSIELNELSFGPVHSLVLDKEIWEHTSGTMAAKLKERKPNSVALPDIKALGLSAGTLVLSVDQALLMDKHVRGSRRFQTSSDGADTVIRAADSNSELVWRLDVNRGGLPTRIIYSEKGVTRNEAVVEIAQFGSVHFPRKVEFFAADHQHGRMPYETIEVSDIRLNDPNMPERFTPGHIGVDAGCNVFRTDAEGQIDPVHYRYDGEQLLTVKAFGERVRVGEIEYGQNFQANAVRAQGLANFLARLKSSPNSSTAAPVADVLDEWTAYVERFARRFRLSSDQSEQALRVLEKVRQRAVEYAAKQKAQFEQLVADEDAFAKLPSEERAAKANIVRERRSALLQPLRDLFQRELVPALERLPTRAQRVAVEPVTTQPAAP